MHMQVCHQLGYADAAPYRDYETVFPVDTYGTGTYDSFSYGTGSYSAHASYGNYASGGGGQISGDASPLPLGPEPTGGGPPSARPSPAGSPSPTSSPTARPAFPHWRPLSPFRSPLSPPETAEDAVAYGELHYGRGSGPIHLDDVSCLTGAERRLPTLIGSILIVRRVLLYCLNI
jgi:hypothetical protein